MYLNILKLITESSERIILNEMSLPRERVIANLFSQTDTIIEHFLNILIFDNTTNDRHDWLRTIAETLDYYNRIEAKTKSIKLKKEDYRRFLFGINETFSLHDAHILIEGYEKKAKKKFHVVDIDYASLVPEFYKKYHALTNYFSEYMEKCKDTETKRYDEFYVTVDKIIKGEEVQWGETC